jgi:hypothetical protein
MVVLAAPSSLEHQFYRQSHVWSDRARPGPMKQKGRAGFDPDAADYFTRAGVPLLDGTRFSAPCLPPGPEALMDDYFNLEPADLRLALRRCFAASFLSSLEVLRSSNSDGALGAISVFMVWLIWCLHFRSAFPSP